MNNSNDEKSETMLEFRISKAKVFMLLIPVVAMVFGSIYVVISSKQISVKIYVILLTIIVSTTLIRICKKLIKDVDNPALIINSNGIYSKGWDTEFISWDNVRLIWSRPYCFPRRLCIETNDQSPADFPHSLFFAALTPGFKDAWKFIKIHHPEKLKGLSRFS